jgi:hypothetical protein
MTRNIYIFMFVLLLLMVFIFNTRETFLGHEYKLGEHVDYKGRVNQYNVEERPFIFDTNFEPQIVVEPTITVGVLPVYIVFRKNDIDYDITCDNENCFINNNIITIRNSGKYIFDFQGFSDNVVLTKLFKVNVESDYVTIDGDNKKFKIETNEYYDGLINNGSKERNGRNYVIVKNIYCDIDINVRNINFIDLQDLQQKKAYGLICSSYFSHNSKSIIHRCRITSNIKMVSYGGGIIGGYAGKGENSNLLVSNCFVKGNMFNDKLEGGDEEINVNHCGGIVGAYCGSNNGNVLLFNCMFNGDINTHNSGGICGSYLGNKGGNILLLKCMNTGTYSPQTLTQQRLGNAGLVGAYCANDNGNVTVLSSYVSNNNIIQISPTTVTGTILTAINNSQRGFFGNNALKNNGNILMVSCFINENNDDNIIINGQNDVSDNGKLEVKYFSSKNTLNQNNFTDVSYNAENINIGDCNELVIEAKVVTEDLLNFNLLSEVRSIYSLTLDEAKKFPYNLSNSDSNDIYNFIKEEEFYSIFSKENDLSDINLRKNFNSELLEIDCIERNRKLKGFVLRDMPKVVKLC